MVSMKKEENLGHYLLFLLSRLNFEEENWHFPKMYGTRNYKSHTRNGKWHLLNTYL